MSPPTGLITRGRGRQAECAEAQSQAPPPMEHQGSGRSFGARQELGHLTMGVSLGVVHENGQPLALR